MKPDTRFEVVAWLIMAVAIGCFMAAIHSITPELDKQDTRNEVTK